MKIALLGFDVDGSNMGCQALVYSFLSLMDETYESNIEYYVFAYGDCNLDHIRKRFSRHKFFLVTTSLKKPNSQVKLYNIFNSCDYIFDITYGDGFSDIYGKGWNARTNLNKELAAISSSTFILLPQTYGPYNSYSLKKWAYHIIKKADYVFSRDDDSAVEVNKKIGSNKVKAYTDLAFLLPYRKLDFGKKKNIGFNVSSTLWDNVHSASIKLKANYQEYCIKTVKKLLEQNYIVHLVPHVIDKNNPNAAENDCRACDNLAKICKDVIVAPAFNDPIEAKSYISGMDAFIGPRMHATIAAFSSSVLTIPVAYSKKFEGLYGSLEYNYLVDLRYLSTEDAVIKTLNLLSCEDELKEAQNWSLKIMSEKIGEFRISIENIIKDM